MFVYVKNTTGDFQPDWSVPLLANFLNSIILRLNVTQMTPFKSNWIENPTSLFYDFLIYAALIYYSMLCSFYWYICVVVLQVCNTFWINFWICSSSWNFIPWVCYNFRPCYHRASPNNSLAVDGSESSGDSRGTLWLSFPMEPFKLSASIWRVSLQYVNLAFT